MWIFKLAPNEKTTECKTCGARIYWAITTNGARCPLDAGFTPFERKTFKLQSGVEVTIIKVSDKASHFATCPQAAQFKRRK